MKVAIIGAGVAGLACALELEKLGIVPDIYEQRYQIDNPAPFTAAMLDVGLISVENQLAHLEKRYKLKLTPLAQIKRLIIHGPTVDLKLAGSFGCLFKMGQENSVPRQLAQKLHTEVMFKKHINYFKIKNQYDFIVLADGSPSIPILLNIWKPTFECWIRTAIIVGQFDTKQVEFWFNREFAREGFAMLAPINEKSASLLLAVNGISRQEIHDYWNTFINKLPAEPNASGFFEMEYQTGSVETNVVDNTFIVGNAGGMVDIFWGHGLFASIISGTEAARSIVKGNNFDKKIRPLVKDNTKLYELRQSLAQLDNRGIDLLLQMHKLPGVKPLAAAVNYSGLKVISNLLSRITGINKERC